MRHRGNRGFEGIALPPVRTRQPIAEFFVQSDGPDQPVIVKDAPDHQVLVRHAGEEFAIVLLAIGIGHAPQPAADVIVADPVNNGIGIGFFERAERQTRRPQMWEAPRMTWG